VIAVGLSVAASASEEQPYIATPAPMRTPSPFTPVLVDGNIVVFGTASVHVAADDARLAFRVTGARDAALGNRLRAALEASGADAIRVGTPNELAPPYVEPTPPPISDRAAFDNYVMALARGPRSQLAQTFDRIDPQSIFHVPDALLAFGIVHHPTAASIDRIVTAVRRAAGTSADIALFGIDFGVRDCDAVAKQLRDAAEAQARDAASTFAATSGLRLGATIAVGKAHAPEECATSRLREPTYRVAPVTDATRTFSTLQRFVFAIER
jgi:hypothetical protein